MPRTHEKNGLTIGTVAARADVNIQTMRYYEGKGLVPRPPRSHSNYRLYPEATVQRVRFIKRAQELGFTLREIKDLLALRSKPGSCSAGVRARAVAKIQDIESKVATLQAMKTALNKLVSTCSGKGPVSACPILESLDREEP